MDDSELKKLRERYSRMSDEEIKQLLLAGSDEFEPDAYNLLVEEARKRQVEIGAEIAASEKDEPEAQALEKELEQEDFAELMVINDAEEARTVKKKLENSAINYYFQSISYRGKELPVALLVQQSKADDAVGLLKDTAFKSSIVLW
ncbi:MAG: hypothetical protein ACM3OC_06255 [Deltaproteobacteria bacterium]